MRGAGGEREDGRGGEIHGGIRDVIRDGIRDGSVGVRRADGTSRPGDALLLLRLQLLPACLVRLSSSPFSSSSSASSSRTVRA